MPNSILEERKPKRYIPTERELQLSTDINERFSDMDSARDDDKWEDFQDQFDNVIDYQSDEDKVNLNLPVEFSQIESKMSEELAKPPEFKFIPVERSDVAKAEVVRHIWDYAWLESDSLLEIHKTYLCKNIFGSGIWKEDWEHREKTCHFPDKVKDGVIETWKTSNVVEYDGVKGKMIDLRLFWLDDGASSIEDASDCIEKEELDYSAFLKYFEKDSRFKNVAKVGGDYFDASSKDFQTKEEDSRTDKKEKVILLHYYNKIKDMYVIIANGVVIRDTYIPFAHKELPYSIFIDHLNYESVYGRGECEILQSGKAEQNILRNSMSDGWRMGISPVVTIGKSAIAEEEDYEWGAGNIWHVGDVNQVSTLDVNGVGVEAFNINNLLNEDHTAFTGVDTRALLSAPSETATKTALKKETALKRINLGLTYIDFALQRMARQRLSNIQQFFPIKVVRRITKYNALGNPYETDVASYRQIRVEGKKVTESTDFVPRPEGAGRDETGNPQSVNTLKFEDTDGYDFFEAKPEYIRGNFDIQVVTGSTLPISQAMKRAETMEMIDVIATKILPFAPQVAQSIQWGGLLEDLIETYDKDPEKILSKQANQASEEEKINAEMEESGIPNPQPNELPQEPLPEGGDPFAGAGQA